MDPETTIGKRPSSCPSRENSLSDLNDPSTVRPPPEVPIYEIKRTGSSLCWGSARDTSEGSGGGPDSWTKGSSFTRN